MNLGKKLTVVNVSICRGVKSIVLLAYLALEQNLESVECRALDMCDDLRDLPIWQRLLAARRHPEKMIKCGGDLGVSS